MSRISTCAACHGDILIPGSAQPADRMRCPLCNAQFQAKDVLAASIQAPPEAIIVEQPHAAIAAAVGPRLSREQPLADFDVGERPSSAIPRSKGPGPIGQMIRIFGGGIVGLTLGYLGLLRFGGAQYDALKILDKLPPKVSVWLKKPPDAPAAAADQPQGPRRSLKDLANMPDTPPPAATDTAPPFEFPAPGSAPAVAPPAPTPPAPLVPQPDAAAPPPAALESSATIEPETSPSGAPATTPLNSEPGPKQLTLYRATELQSAIADTGPLVGCPTCNSTGFVRRPVVTGVREVKGERVERTADRRVACEACGGKPPLRMTPEAYTRLCHLAEVVTFVDKSSAPDNELTLLADQVQKLIGAAGADQRSIEAIGRLAGYQLEQPDRKENGVALAGTVQQISQEGKFFTMRVVLLGLPKVVTVVSRRPPQTAIKEHDRVIILGSIINDPVENLNGYLGKMPQVVWGGMPIRLATP
jgi:hypothetical protein